MVKTKFSNERNDSILGAKIKSIRRELGITQDELGTRVGLGKSSISKIENGLAHISLEDAVYLLKAMDESLSIQVLGMEEPKEVKERKSQFITVCVLWFSQAYHVTPDQAFRYLTAFKAIDFLEENFSYEQTLSQEEIIDDMTRVCENHGGVLKNL